MALQTTLTIRIGETTISTFLNFMLAQDIEEHHFLTLECREDELLLQNPGLKGDFQQLVGEPIMVTMQCQESIFSTSIGNFKGIVTQVKMRKSDGFSKGKTVTFKAFSPTILMDNGPESLSFLKKDLKSIVNSALSNYDVKLLETVVKPEKNTPYPYVVQYNQSDYDFIGRLCARQGEWFYYNGQKLIIGNEDASKVIDLRYGFDLIEYDFEMSLQPTRFKYHTNDVSEGASHQSPTSIHEGSVNGLNQSILQTSGKIFAKETTVQHNQLVSETMGQSDTDQFSRLSFDQKVANMVFVSGRSEDPAVRPGAIINILDENQDSKGHFRVIEATHHCIDTGEYENSFKAIPEQVKISPYAQPSDYTKCESQMATVIDNNDPKGLGRVLVQMAWQKPVGETTDWIPLISSHGGEGKGMHFIPEIGETVLVDFQSGNAEMPFVAGNLYHNQAKSGFHDADNNIKALQTRSGTKIIMHDGEGSVTVEDPSGNIWHMDGDGNISVNAPKNITLNAGKDFVINVGENMTTTVGKNKNTDITNKYTINSESHNETVSQNKTIEVGGDLKETTATTTHKALTGDVLIQSAGVATILGDIDAKINKS